MCFQTTLAHRFGKDECRRICQCATFRYSSNTILIQLSYMRRFKFAKRILQYLYWSSGIPILALPRSGTVLAQHQGSNYVASSKRLEEQGWWRYNIHLKCRRKISSFQDAALFMCSTITLNRFPKERWSYQIYSLAPCGRNT